MRFVCTLLVVSLASLPATADVCSKAEDADRAFAKQFAAIGAQAVDAGLRCLYHGPDDAVIKKFEKRLGTVAAVVLPNTPLTCIKGVTGLTEYMTELGASVAPLLKRTYITCSSAMQKRILDGRKTGKNEDDILADLQQLSAAWVQSALAPKK